MDNMYELDDNSIDLYMENLLRDALFNDPEHTAYVGEDKIEKLTSLGKQKKQELDEYIQEKIQYSKALVFQKVCIEGKYCETRAKGGSDKANLAALIADCLFAGFIFPIPPNTLAIYAMRKYYFDEICDCIVEK